MGVKFMLAAILKTGKLTAAERELFGKMSDQFNKCGRVTRTQGRQIVEAYQKTTPPDAVLSVKGLEREKDVRSWAEFEAACPDLPKTSKNYLAAEDFFSRGGNLLKLRPALA